MPISRFTSKRRIIQIQYVEDLSKDEIENQRFAFIEDGWRNVKVKNRLDLAGSGWKAYEWTGIPDG